ncbi:amidase [Pseudonocardia zijingensis]|uniref:Amidase n=1 Tax=Pseudonocardia zijingensis TaxID=153376 RepID=A0ABN1QEW0_9PSEU
MTIGENTTTRLSAVELARLTRSGELGAAEVVQAHIAEIERLNPAVNAIVDLRPERALAAARELDRTFRSDAPHGPLYGLPVAHKDLVPAAGFRFTQGSPIFAERVADQDHLVVERMAAAGAITVGKTNVPEFGLGSQTFNDVYGVTRNPHALDRTAGGSSGGAAAALAARMLPLADGSDTGGSLRNPASFCGVVGFRPSPGRVPSWPDADPFGRLAVVGPMARTVDDLALLLSVLAGPDPRAGWSAPPAPQPYFPVPDAGRPIRLAWSPDVDGRVVVAREVRAALEPVVAALEGQGWQVELATPDLGDAIEAFRVLRALKMQLSLAPVLAEHPGRLKSDAVWNIEEGGKLDGPTIARAERTAVRIFHEMREFFGTFDVLATPTCQVAPFGIGTRYPREIDGTPMRDYLEWMGVPAAITMTGCPAISLPAATTPDGLPVGIQLVGPHLREDRLLAVARAFESAIGTGPAPEVDPTPRPAFVAVD